MQISYYELMHRYDDMLDDVYGPVKIGPYEYSTSEALRSIDRIAYEQGFHDWLDSENLIDNGDETYSVREE